MEPNIPTSFIPKAPVSGNIKPKMQSSTGSRTIGLLSLVTTIVFIATALSFAGVYFYEERLGSQKNSLEQSISSARDGLGTEFVSDMQRLGARIEGVKILLKNHVVVSPVFEELQNRTLRSIQYKQFNYTINKDAQSGSSSVEVTLTGTARSYAIIALQSDAFAESRFIKNPVFSNLSTDEGGTIGFSLRFTVSMEDLSYQKFIEKRNASVQ